jgi:hypothetical protein
VNNYVVRAGTAIAKISLIYMSNNSCHALGTDYEALQQCSSNGRSVPKPLYHQILGRQQQRSQLLQLLLEFNINICRGEEDEKLQIHTTRRNMIQIVNSGKFSRDPQFSHLA